MTLRVTVVPLTNAAAHVGPQAMPAGRLVTVMPGPDPSGVTSTHSNAGTRMRYGMKGAAIGVRDTLPSTSRASR